MSAVDAPEIACTSHPSRVRGLKYQHQRGAKNRRRVAPLAGAWIEITFARRHPHTHPVAPLAGAWIEIVVVDFITAFFLVAPLAGAWIEICLSSEFGIDFPGRTPRGCVD